VWNGRRRKSAINCQREREAATSEPGSPSSAAKPKTLLPRLGSSTRDQTDNFALICRRRPPLHLDSTRLHTVSPDPLVTPYKTGIPTLTFNQGHTTTTDITSEKLSRSSLEATKSNPPRLRTWPAMVKPAALLASAWAPSTSRTSLLRPSRPRFLTRTCTSCRRRPN
jgi:hypothetical protein